jgi:hypothetical protein
MIWNKGGYKKAALLEKNKEIKKMNLKEKVLKRISEKDSPLTITIQELKDKILSEAERIEEPTKEQEDIVYYQLSAIDDCLKAKLNDIPEDVFIKLVKWTRFYFEKSHKADISIEEVENDKNI